MKKVYEKPEIMYEDFSLSTSIAVGCEVDTPLPTYEENCGYPIRGGVVFMTGTDCTHPPQTEDGEDNGFCYHVPVESNNLFNS